MIFRLYDGIRTADATPEIDLSLELYRLLAEFARPLRSEENSLHYEANIRDAKQYVNEHLNQTIRVGDLAQAVHMSPRISLGFLNNKPVSLPMIMCWYPG